MVARKFRSFFVYFVSALFPDFCVLCKKEGSLLCYTHFQTLECAPENQIEFGFLDYVFAAGAYYDPTVKKLISRFKFEGHKKAGKILGDFLAKKLLLDLRMLDKISVVEKKQDCSDKHESCLDYYVIPMPIHPFRRFFRGFNQSEILGLIVYENLRKKFPDISFVYKNDLVCRKYTRQQSHLSKEERYKNVRETFFVSELVSQNIKSKGVIIVDDVVATGSSLDELAKILKGAGAEKVMGIAVARGAKI